MEVIASSRQGMLTVHESVGAVIERNGRFLLVDRRYPPYGFAGVAGHVDEGEHPDRALKREVMEESHLIVTDSSLLFDEIITWNSCGKGGDAHHWRIYRCETTGDAVLNEQEAKSLSWYTPKQLAALPLEPVWRYWFTKLNVLPS